MTLNALAGILIPFAGTSLGAAFVFLMRGQIRPWIQKLLLGFASGVMIAASVWSLLIPAINMSEGGGLPAWFPAAVGFIAGIAFYCCSTPSYRTSTWTATSPKAAPPGWAEAPCFF